MDLTEFRIKYRVNDNIFWTLQSGEMQNLLDEAIEIIEGYEQVKVEPEVKPACVNCKYLVKYPHHQELERTCGHPFVEQIIGVIDYRESTIFGCSQFESKSV